MERRLRRCYATQIFTDKKNPFTSAVRSIAAANRLRYLRANKIDANISHRLWNKTGGFGSY